MKPKIVFKDESDKDLPKIDDVKLGETQAGKTVQMSRNSIGYWEINFKEGGELPEPLQGTFTDYHMAARAVDAYLENKKQ